MILSVLKEPAFETRVSLLAETAALFVKRGVQIWVESGAGINASCSDEAYRLAGVEIKTRREILQDAEIILSVHPPVPDEVERLQSKVLVGVYQPLFNYLQIAVWAKQQVTTFSLDMLPRTTRAQGMDVLSSQASIAGYKAVLLAANIFPRYFPMLMTAAGSIPPARIMIIGAGVAGLQAVATARRLGAVVEVFDSRPAVKEEVMSLGARFIEVEGAADASKAGGYAVEQSAEFLLKQQARIAEVIAKSDIVITTAQLPGKKAPVIITAKMIEAMKNGSVIIDLAAATGGNTALTRNNEMVMHQGVVIIGNSNLPATMPYDASRLYGKNVFNFLQLIIGIDSRLNLNFADDLVKGCCITHGGYVVHERIQALASPEVVAST